MIESVLPKAIKDFLETESASGKIMIAFSALALILANSPWHLLYQKLVAYPLTIGFASWSFSHTVTEWVQDVLMVFFFLIVALELKSEMVAGSLSQKDKILLPLLAAVGGMMIPALIYLLFNANHPAHWQGWAIPSATDIAFALCVLTLVGKRVPAEIKIFLLAIAIFDDLGAIIIIAAFYSSKIILMPLALGLLTIGVFVLLNRNNVISVIPYYIVGIILWFCLYSGGLHTTLAGVVVGISIPMVSPKNPEISPLNQHMAFLHPWVSFIILPLFALTSAGITLIGLPFQNVFSSIPLGVACGLFFGKQLGIFVTTFLLIKSRLVTPIEGVTWSQIYGVSVLAGIGFTMSLFITLLAFENKAMEDMAKLGVIMGSLLSTLLGYIVFQFFTNHNGNKANQHAH